MVQTTNFPIPIQPLKFLQRTKQVNLFCSHQRLHCIILILKSSSVQEDGNFYSKSCRYNNIIIVGYHSKHQRLHDPLTFSVETLLGRPYQLSIIL